jgi:diguanylate cyclase (GGDEF)-like protein/PAS domain S-box-containing protein
MGNWLWNIENNNLTWSDEIYRIFGLDSKSTSPTYEKLLLSIHPDDRSEVEASVAAALNEHQDYTVEHRIQLPDGSERYVRENGAVVCDEQNRPTHMLGTVQDITETYLAHQRVQNREEHLHSLIEQAPDGIFIADINGCYTEVNESGCRMLGYTQDELVGKTIVDIIPAEDIPRLEQSREQLLRGENDISEWSLLHKDGHYVPVEVSARILADGRWQGFVRDISERKESEKKLLLSTAVFENTSEAIMITDHASHIIAVNQAYTEITGYTADEVLGRNPKVLKSGQHDQEFYQQLWNALNTYGQWQGEIWNRRKNGEIFPAWENISVVKDSDGEITNYVSVMSDISSIKEVEQQLSHMAHHDALTTLPNRMAFMLSLDRAMEHAKRNKTKIALLFLDLDHFKLVNDTLGHDKGDELLKRISERLKNSARAEDVVARLGGDEFVIVLEDIDRPQDAALFAQKIIDAVSKPIQLEKNDLSTSTSVGISIYPDDATTFSDFLRAADSAMYRAKNRGRGKYEFYTEELTSQAMHRLSIENDMRKAIMENQFRLYYQPQVEVTSGRIIGVEALLRWQHPEHGLIMPDQFIQIAEECGLIDSIGNWAIKEAISQARQWDNEDMPTLRVSINISGHQLIYDGGLKSVQSALFENGYTSDDNRFELEITESILQASHNAIITLQKLRKLGLTIAIDDFGTGYSSLSQLKHLPIDTLKIDRAFLESINSGSDELAIVTAIITLGHSLGLRIVAEGVETEEQLNFLISNNCDEIQGHLISEPVEPDKIRSLVLRNWTLTDRDCANI